MSTVQPTYYGYVVKCADNTLYTGWTTDPEKRLAAHNSGKGAKYTRARLPVTLVKVWTFESAREAQSWEWHFKRLSKKQKLQALSSS